MNPFLAFTLAWSEHSQRFLGFDWSVFMLIRRKERQQAIETRRVHSDSLPVAAMSDARG
jgi:hypothetical protein